MSIGTVSERLKPTASSLDRHEIPPSHSALVAWNGGVRLLVFETLYVESSTRKQGPQMRLVGKMHNSQIPEVPCGKRGSGKMILKRLAGQRRLPILG